MKLYEQEINDFLEATKTKMWKKITKKDFVDFLTKNQTSFICSKFNWNDEDCIEALDKIYEVVKEKRSAIARSNYIIFNDDSRLYLNQKGIKEYFKYTNKYDINFLIRKIIYKDDYNNEEYQNYVIYSI